MKICFAASSGGHYEQILMLMPLMKKYDSFILTERTRYQISMEGIDTYCLYQVNRKEISSVFKMIANTAKTCYVFMKEKPDVVICTGVLATIPICLLAKICNRKLVYIESFAKVTSASLTGRLMYRFADRFYVQWESMLDIFPKAECLGGIY